MLTLAELMSLRGRVALVTGGGGHIGMAIAEALAELGCDVCLLDRNGDALPSAKAHLTQRWNVRVEPLAIDLEDEEQRLSVPVEVTNLFGRLDVLVNNAAFVGDSELKGWAVPFEEQRVDTWRRALEVNVIAAFQLSQVCAPLLRGRGAGAIVNVSSISGVVGPDMELYAETSMGNPAAYAVSKGGIIQMTRWLATVLSPDVRVNCISPGGVFRNQPTPFVDRYSQRTPLKRMATEQDFKGAVAFFASGLSSYVTGENLMVDGGWTAW
jgi:NAD(P)-dependent dehydrogenase (short-subunit alcohol dehydrogenase family)